MVISKNKNKFASTSFTDADCSASLYTKGLNIRRYFFSPRVIHKTTTYHHNVAKGRKV